MDISNKYIKMCEKAVEVQEAWRPTRGDMYFHSTEKLVVVYGYWVTIYDNFEYTGDKTNVFRTKEEAIDHIVNKYYLDLLNDLRVYADNEMGGINNDTINQAADIYNLYSKYASIVDDDYCRMLYSIERKLISACDNCMYHNNLRDTGGDLIKRDEATETYNKLYNSIKRWNIKVGHQHLYFTGGLHLYY